MNIILLIMNCHKYKHKAVQQKNTWLKQLTIPYYHILGDETLPTEYIIDNANRTIVLKVKDDYNSLPQKVIRAYALIHKLFNYSYIFKTDDDQMVSSMHFFDILSNILLKNANIHYGGHIVTIHNNHISKYNLVHDELPSGIMLKPTKYCSGRFYFLSREAVSSLITNENIRNIDKEYFEDYAIGYYLNAPFKLNMLQLNTNANFIG